MRILIIGNGGREHALAWRISRDSVKPEIFCAPGNAGTASLAKNIPINAEDIAGLVAWCRRESPDLVVVGPEVPLCMGLVDELSAHGIKAFGPSRAAAKLEGSKAFGKDVMLKAGVPTAKSETFTSKSKISEYVNAHGLPVVLKADGLAAGKGVYVCQTIAQVDAALNDMFIGRIFGAAAEQVVVEDFLDGEEASVLALVDGKNIVLLPTAQDHKRIFNNDDGPNTGGMGAYSPAPVVADSMLDEIRKTVFMPMLAELGRRGIEYRGVLYAGLMISKSGLKVLEFNCRFGDPETQAIMMRIGGEFLPALFACVDGTLRPELLTIRPESSVCVVMASGGYPGSYEKGKVISGLQDLSSEDDIMVFHAGTAEKNGEVVTSGGRVLGLTATAGTLAAAVKKVYRALLKVSFDQAQYRTDIARRALKGNAE
jgi:phosphoribosylamine---glycine ligase